MFPGEDPAQLRRQLASTIKADLDFELVQGAYACNTVSIGNPNAKVGDLHLLRQQYDRLLNLDGPSGAEYLDQTDARAFLILRRKPRIRIVLVGQDFDDSMTGLVKEGEDLVVLYGSEHYQRLELVQDGSPSVRLSLSIALVCRLR